MEDQQLYHNFKHHPPKTNLQVEKHDRIRLASRDLAMMINYFVPESREKSLAITKLEEVMFWSNAGLARNQEDDSGN